MEDAGSSVSGLLFAVNISNGMKVVGRVVLPVRQSLKTEAEVATLWLVRGCLPLI
jgi:hypothetical protein